MLERKSYRNFIFCLCVLALTLPGVVIAAENSGDKPEVTGPVPAFKQRGQAKRLRENVYFTVAYPEFGIAFVDEAIQKRVNLFIKENGGFKAFRLEKDEDDRIIPRQFALSYHLYAPKPGVLSVLFGEWIYLDGPGGHVNEDASTYDLRAKKQLRLGDVFPRWDTAKKDLLPLLKDGFDDFAKECPYLKLETMLSKNSTNFYLDTEGLTVVFAMGYAPADQWGCGRLSVGKDDLEEIGADMRWWMARGALQSTPQ